MITRPAAGAGLAFEAELPERIFDYTRAEPGALPFRAFTLEQLYATRTREGQLTQAAYERFGGVKGAISRGVLSVRVRSKATNALTALLGSPSMLPPVTFI
jgi:hypothetical protein